MSFSEQSEDAVPVIQLRIPGPWRSSEEVETSVREATHGAWRIESDGGLIEVATGTRYQLNHTPHDDDIAGLFAESGRMAEEDADRLATHPVKIHVSAPGGSIEAAMAIMEAARALIESGGYGVFVDNSGIAHPPDDWRKLTDGRDDGGVYWAYVSTTDDQEEQEMYTTGMHCLGYRDAAMPRPPQREAGAFFLNNFQGYCYQSGRPVIDGDTLDDLQGPLFRAIHRPCTRYAAGTAFYNPYGVWWLEPVMGVEEEGGEAADN